MQHRYLPRQSQGRAVFVLRLLLTLPLLFLLLAFISCYGCSQPHGAPAGTIIIEGGAVKERTLFTLDELKSMEEGLVEDDYLGLNSYGTRQHTHFKGIGIGYLLRDKVGLKDHASNVVFQAEDDYTVEYLLEDVMREDYIDEQNPGKKYKMILAWEEDGREYDSKKGNPFRLVVGQKEPGDVNKPCWVQHVKRICID